MKPKVTATGLPEVLLIEPHVFADERGFFLESYNEADFAAATGVRTRFVQDNHSRSAHAVVRGLHYQVEHCQGKLVRVVNGRIFDVCVDVRRNSPGLGRWTAVELDGSSPGQLWIPPGFAHGFLVLSETADVLYKTTEYRAPAYERSIAWNDPELAIAWPLERLHRAPVLSPRDAQAPGWRDAPLCDIV